MRLRMMGGIFGLERPLVYEKPAAMPAVNWGAEPKYLATARGAFSLLDIALRPNTIWLPSYLCGVVLDCFTRVDSRIAYFPISDKCRLERTEWIAEVQQGDLVIFIDYFGFNTWSDVGSAVRDRGAWIVEDACQAMLNLEFDCSSHYVVCSPRKFVGVPDGGILAVNPGAPPVRGPLSSTPAAWWTGAFAASLGRALFDAGDNDRSWYELFQATDKTAPALPYAMSELSQHILGALDYAGMAAQRRANYIHLAEQLQDVALFPILADDVVPLGFPVVVNDRDRLRGVLFKHAIYPPVHWSIDGIVPPEFADSHRLAARIMTLPCDQRCSTSDMQRMTVILREALHA